MTGRHFLYMIVIIAVISEVIYPTNTNSWIYLSIGAYAICAVFLIASMAFALFKRKTVAVKAVALAIVTFTAYAEITVVCYMRMIDKIISAGPLVIIVFIVAAGMFWEATSEMVKNK